MCIHSAAGTEEKKYVVENANVLKIQKGRPKQKGAGDRECVTSFEYGSRRRKP
jgi:hypothetical protein